MENSKPIALLDRIQPELKVALMSFIMEEISYRSNFGVTYALVSKDDKKRIEQMKKIEELANNDRSLKRGFKSLFAVKVLCNGYIYEVPLEIIKLVNREIMKELKTEESRQQMKNGNCLDLSEIMSSIDPDKALTNTQAEQRKKEEIIKCVKYIKDQRSKGIKVLNFAIYSRNTTNATSFMATSENGEEVNVEMKSFILREEDLKDLYMVMSRYNLEIMTRNNKLGIEFGEILPSKTGINFKMVLL